MLRCARRSAEQSLDPVASAVVSWLPPWLQPAARRRASPRGETEAFVADNDATEPVQLDHRARFAATPPIVPIDVAAVVLRDGHPQRLLLTSAHCMHIARMTNVRIRDVPEAARNELVRRAELAGQSLQQYLTAQLASIVATPRAAPLDRGAKCSTRKATRTLAEYCRTS
jgi:hypothetical protein